MQERNADGRRKEVSGFFRWDLLSVSGNFPGLEKGSQCEQCLGPPTDLHPIPQ